MRVALALVEPQDIAVAKEVLRNAEHDLVTLDDDLDVVVADASIIDSISRADVEFVILGGADIASVSLDRPLDPTTLRRALDDLGGGQAGIRRANELVCEESLFAGPSTAIQNLRQDLSRIAQSDEPVSIFSEDGSGRWVVARAIHDRGPRREQPFVMLNAVAHPPERLDELLFGPRGALVTAATGTLFIDRMSMTAQSTQRRLVHALQITTTQRVRMIAGMRTGIAVGIGPQNVIPDLYYPMKVFELEIPRLAARTRDLEAIVTVMLARLGHLATPGIAVEALRLLQRYSFPGNLLELAHALMHAVVVAAGSTIRSEHLPVSIRRSVDEQAVEVQTLASLDEVVRRFERDYLLQVLRAVGGNRGRAAAILQLSRKGLWGKLKAHAITDEEIHMASELPVH